MICSIYKGKQIEFYDLIIMIHMTVCIDSVLHLLYETLYRIKILLLARSNKNMEREGGCIS